MKLLSKIMVAAVAYANIATFGAKEEKKTPEELREESGYAIHSIAQELKPAHEITKKVGIKDIVKNLNTYLEQPVVKTTGDKKEAAVEALHEFTRHHNFNQLNKNLIELQKLLGTKINNKPLDSEALKDLKEKWKKKVFDKYGYILQQWFEEIYHVLDPISRHNLGKRPIDPTKITLYHLESKIQGQLKKQEGTDNNELLKIRDTILTISKTSKAISRALGMTGRPRQFIPKK